MEQEYNEDNLQSLMDQIGINPTNYQYGKEVHSFKINEQEKKDELVSENKGESFIEENNSQKGDTYYKRKFNLQREIKVNNKKQKGEVKGYNKKKMNFHKRAQNSFNSNNNSFSITTKSITQYNQYKTNLNIKKYDNENYILYSTCNKSKEQRIDEFIQRCKENQKKHKDKLEKLKQEYAAIEKAKHTPIHKKSNTATDKKSNSERQTEFLERMKKVQEDLKEKREIMLKEKEKKFQEEHRKKNQKKISQEKVNQKIQDIYEWEARRKEKLQEKAKLREEMENKEMRRCFKPNVSFSSKKLIKNNFNYSSDNAFERLYHEDIQKRKEKKELLNHIYTPSFKPTLNHNNKYDIRIRDSSMESFKNYMTNAEIENLLRIRVNIKRKNL